ncbi:MAG TPA: PaaI family thioesterase [Acidimicrobiia bacterium]|nr:PaaI family thioesterase [Acidimicrobiia bacterium]
MSVPELLDSDRFAVSRLGARLVEASPDRIVVEMTVAPHHLDESARVSAGALFSLADCAMSLLSNAETTAVAVATHFTMREGPAAGATVRAVAEPELPGRARATTWFVVVTSEDTPVASFTGTTLRVNDH